MATGEQYVVEKIVAKRNRRGAVQYLIKWTGCDDSQNTWEPEGNLKCDALLKQFLAENAAAKSNKRAKSSKYLPTVNDHSDEMEEARAGGSGKRGRPSKSLSTEREQADTKDAKEEDVSKTQERSSKLLPQNKEQANTNDANKNAGPVEIVQKEIEKLSVLAASKKMAKKFPDSRKQQSDGISVYPMKVSSVENNESKKRQRKPINNNNERSLKPMLGSTSKKDVKLNGFERGHTVSSLVGITEEDDKLCFMVQFQESAEMEMIPSAEVRKFVPEMMIDFYEDRIIWNQKSGAKRRRN